MTDSLSCRAKSMYLGKNPCARSPSHSASSVAGRCHFTPSRVQALISCTRALRRSLCAFTSSCQGEYLAGTGGGGDCSIDAFRRRGLCRQSPRRIARGRRRRCACLCSFHGRRWCSRALLRSGGASQCNDAKRCKQLFHDDPLPDRNVPRSAKQETVEKTATRHNRATGAA